MPLTYHYNHCRALLRLLRLYVYVHTPVRLSPSNTRTSCPSGPGSFFQRNCKANLTSAILPGVSALGLTAGE